MKYESMESLSRYFLEAGRSKPLTQEEESILSEKIKQGDTKALETLIKANLKFVIRVAQAYTNQGVPLEDLVSYGNMGLIRAAKSFDGTKNFKFISYAVWWIRQSMLNGMAECSRFVRVPINKALDIHTFGKAYKRLETKYMRIPTVEELALELKESKEHVQDMINLTIPTVSLNAGIDGVSDDLVNSIQSDSITDTQAEEQSLRNAMKVVLDLLKDKREREIVCLYYGLIGNHAMTLEEIGERKGLTRERVRQIRDKAIGRLKTIRNREIIKDLAG
jgi:RNA polymerase primary sigma factor